MAYRDQFCALLRWLADTKFIRIDQITGYIVLIVSRTVVDAIKTSFWSIPGRNRAKTDVFIQSRKPRRSVIQFFVNYVKSKGFRAQRCYTSIYKHAYCGSIEPKNKSLGPSEAEISIAHNRDKAHYRNARGAHCSHCRRIMLPIFLNSAYPN